jgi:glycosyltransferase involved in cell wall biosynthesis
MRIVIFQDTYHPTFNGVVVSTDLFVQGLRERGHQVMLVVPHYPGSQPSTDPNVISVEAFKTDFIYPNSCLGKFWKSNLGPALRAFKPDLIHSMTEFFIGHILATYWAHKLRLPRVHTFHTQWTEYLFYVWIPTVLTQPALRFVFSLAVRLFGDAVIAPSDGFARVLREEWKMKSLPVDVLPTGIDLSRFQDMHGDAFRARHGIAPHEQVVLYLGRLGTEKNVELAIETMAELRRRGQPNLRFVVAGGGPAPYLRDLRALAEKRGLQDIIWTGFISGQDWSDCYGAANLTLFPSLTETQGLVVLESLAAGVPLVSVKATGPESTMAGEKGCLFAKATVEDFTDKA